MTSENTMSTYKKIFDAVEEAIFVKQARNADECAKYVQVSLGLKNVNPREIEKIIHKVATQYKPQG